MVLNMARPLQDLSGLRFGHILILRPSVPGYYLCRCDCGNTLVLPHKLFRSERTRFSCPDCRPVTDYRLRAIHTRLLRRAENRPDLPLYPGWETFAGFARWALGSGYPRRGVYLIFKDKYGGFVPGNCEWSREPANIRYRKKEQKDDCN